MDHTLEEYMSKKQQKPAISEESQEIDGSDETRNIQEDQPLAPDPQPGQAELGTHPPRDSQESPQPEAPASPETTPAGDADDGNASGPAARRFRLPFFKGKSGSRKGRGPSGWFPRKDDPPENRYFKILVWSFVGIAVLVVLSAVTAFIVALQGAETITVPALTDEELGNAMEQLQARGLYAQIEQRFFSDPSLKGRVVEQKPGPGSRLKAGRSVLLTVSKGAVVDRVDDYIGRQLQEVEQELQVLFATYKPLLQITGNSVNYVFDDSEPGTILDQDPAPGAELTGLTPLNLLVSRGPEVQTFSVPNYVNLDYNRAMSLLAGQNQPFTFTLADVDETTAGGIVVSQEPQPGAVVEQSTPVSLEIQPIRRVGARQVFGLFTRTLPRYAVPVELFVEVIEPSGERRELFTTQHPGGQISFPYLLEEGAQIVVSAFGGELLRYLVVKEEE